MWPQLDGNVSIIKKYTFFRKVIKAKTVSFYDLIRLLFFLLFCFVYGFKIQYGKFLYLDKTFMSYYRALVMVSKTKATSFYDLIRTLSLVLLLRFWLQTQSGKFLCLHKTFVLCCFAWFMAIKFKKRIFWDLIKTLFLVLLLCLWLQKPKPEVSMTW